MKKLLINSESGEQIVIDISPSGSFSDMSRVIWDERFQGDLPANFEVGKMELVNGSLVKRDTYIPAHQQYLDTLNQEIITQKIAALWAAADAYINSEINGVGLSILAAGVVSNAPKCKAVAVWVDSIWTEYYNRKALVTVTSENDLDFSPHGPKPFTVLEMREEVSSMWEVA